MRKQDRAWMARRETLDEPRGLLNLIFIQKKIAQRVFRFDSFAKVAVRERSGVGVCPLVVDCHLHHHRLGVHWHWLLVCPLLPTIVKVKVHDSKAGAERSADKEARPFPFFCTRITTCCYPDRVAPWPSCHTRITTCC